MIVEYERGGATPGRITHIVLVYRPEYPAFMRERGEHFLEVDETSADPDKRYVDDGRIKDRPTALIALSAEAIRADGVDTAMLQGVPAGWEIRIDGASAGAADGSDIEIVSAEPHAYAIEAVGPWPYRPWRGQVTAR
jgi:hypothetical protein